jgi:hypothetical protein
MVTILLITVIYRKAECAAIRSPSGEQSRTFLNRFHKICVWILHSSRTYLYEISRSLLFTSSFYIPLRNYITVPPSSFIEREKEKESDWAGILMTLDRPSLFGVVLIHPMLILTETNYMGVHCSLVFGTAAPPPQREPGSPHSRDF